MTKEVLEERIRKTEETISKKEKLLERYYKKIDKISSSNEYENEEWRECDLEGCKDDIKRTERSLNEKKELLEKYKGELNKVNEDRNIYDKYVPESMKEGNSSVKYIQNEIDNLREYLEGINNYENLKELVECKKSLDRCSEEIDRVCKIKKILVVIGGERLSSDFTDEVYDKFGYCIIVATIEDTLFYKDIIRFIDYVKDTDIIILKDGWDSDKKWKVLKRSVVDIILQACEPRLFICYEDESGKWDFTKLDSEGFLEGEYWMEVK